MKKNLLILMFMITSTISFSFGNTYEEYKLLKNNSYPIADIENIPTTSLGQRGALEYLYIKNYSTISIDKKLFKAMATEEKYDRSLARLELKPVVTGQAGWKEYQYIKNYSAASIDKKE